MERKTVSREGVSFLWELDGNTLESAIKTLNEQFNRVPEEYRNAARLDVRSYSDSGSELVVVWREPETDDEMAIRKKHEQEMLERERQQYEALAKKFGHKA